MSKETGRTTPEQRAKALEKRAAGYGVKMTPEQVKRAAKVLENRARKSGGS